MDYQKFIDGLPTLYDNWNQELVEPKLNEFQKVLEQVQDTTTSQVMQILNWAVDCLENNEIYCQFGCDEEANFIGALLNHPEQIAYAIDNFYGKDQTGEKWEKFQEKITTFGLEEQVLVCDQEVEEFFLSLREAESEDKIGVYFYNGPSDYRSQLLGLLLVKPWLAERALIIVANTKDVATQQACWDFITAHSQCKLLLDFSTLNEKIARFCQGVQIFSWDIKSKHNYEFTEIRERRDTTFMKSISKWNELLKKQKKDLETLWQEAMEFHRYDRFEEAELRYKQLLELDEKKNDIFLNLGMLYYKQNRDQEALQMLLKSLDFEGVQAVHHYNLGLVLERIGDINTAMIAYQKAIKLNPNWIEPYNNLGNILLETRQLEQAEIVYRMAIRENAQHFGSYLNLGNVLMELHRIDEAVENYQKALTLKPEEPDILYNLAVAVEAQNDPKQAALYYGFSYYGRGEYQEALQQYQKFLEYQPIGDENFYVALADCYRHLELKEETVKVYQESIKHHPQSVLLHFSLVIALQTLGQIEDAITFATEASKLFPERLIFKLEQKRLLPIIYDNETEIEMYRNQFSSGIEELIHQTSLDTREEQTTALMDVGSNTNFYLQYQGKNDLEIQIKYGNFVHKVMAVNYPQWVKPLPMLPLKRNEKIRIGYMSNCMRAHTVGKLMLGWLQHHNSNDFEIYCYYNDRIVDSYTQSFRLSSDFFHHISDNNFESLCQQIYDDHLHILVFFDIGMFPPITQISGLRLAPVQCTTWGHPITTGTPTIDYFLSSALMEPENAQSHYSEELICLPNIGIAYPKRILPDITKKRSDFVDFNRKSFLREDAILYLSCQSLYKYLPQYDYVFAAIAKQVPQSQFVFLYNTSMLISEKFRQRLQRAFAKFDLNSDDYCVILPRQKTQDYLQLNLLSDIFLDTFSWSGGNTTLEAIACNLPIVTCPGEFMRGRHSYGILKMLGVTDTIAQTQDEYIEIAVRLGLDPQWREKIVQKMIERHGNLYDDTTCVEALEDFYRRVVRERQSIIQN